MSYLGRVLHKITRPLALVGGVRSATLAADDTLTLRSEQLQSLDPGGASRNVDLPAEEGASGLFYVFYNAADAAEDLVIRNDAAGTIMTLNQGEAGLVACTGTAWVALGPVATG